MKDYITASSKKFTVTSETKEQVIDTFLDKYARHLIGTEAVKRFKEDIRSAA